MDFTQEYLKSVLHYDRMTGVFTWLKGKTAGKVAGCMLESGYWTIRVERKNYRAHRLAWFYVYGNVPDMIDHKDGDKLNNRIANLREVTNSQNQINRVDTISQTGVRGVTKQRNKFIAYTTENGRTIRLGSYNTIEEARAARETYLRITRKEFAL